MPRHFNLLDVSNTAVVVVDLQEAFAAAIPDFGTLANRAATMVRGARELSLPIVITEQVPSKLGPTVDVVRAAVAPGQVVFDKTTFSSCGASGFVQQLAGRKQVLVCGIEAHICVNQTAHDLLALGCQVHVLTDAVGSRAARDREAGLSKMFHSGAVPSSVEMALFELLRDAKHECFRGFQKLVK
jgi:nicotinamidase-related amidase